jgi:hypothetical protein
VRAISRKGVREAGKRLEVKNIQDDPPCGVSSEVRFMSSAADGEFRRSVT